MKRMMVGIMALVLSTGVHAQIPVTDGAALAKMLQQLETARNMLQQAQESYDQAQDHFEKNKELIEGNDWLAVANSISNEYGYIPIENWQDINDIDVTALRDRYGLRSQDPEMQEVFDQRMRYLAANEAAYSAQQQHLENIEALRGRASSVSTPQQREELANAISLELAAMQSAQNRIQTINRNMDRDAELRETAANRRLREMFQPVDE